MFELYLREIRDGYFYKTPFPGPRIKYTAKPLAISKIKSLIKTLESKGLISGGCTNRSETSGANRSETSGNNEGQLIINNWGQLMINNGGEFIIIKQEK